VSATDPLSIDALRERHPEWSTWLAVHSVVREAVGARTWAAAVPAEPAGDGATTPLLTDAVLAVDERSATRLVDTLLGAAGAPALGPESAIALLDAAVAQETDRLATIAAGASIDPALLGAVASLAASPLLQA
jgi:hypothetical protein